MKCSECGGIVIKIQNDIYCPDGSKSGTYNCQKCGREKSWKIKGPGEEVIDMS